ncbi:hypothetical protein CBOM_05172 [Ceraceosorus bombacis]|uniref:Retrotransposon gag domain n=1 Tax=Ceraceosorus bombacis TaxID=401625 RepID=A0A0P1BJR5_9BASI|nr:hypothetical protein CBOM_05172 [Ceraceosorus bombacis]
MTSNVGVPQVVDLTGELDQDVRAWLRSFEAQMFYSNRDTDTQKAKGLGFCIRKDSPAEKWYNALGAADKENLSVLRASLLNTFKVVDGVKQKDHLIFQDLCQRAISTERLLDDVLDARGQGTIPRLHQYLRELLESSNKVPVEKMAEDIKADMVSRRSQRRRGKARAMSVRSDESVGSSGATPPEGLTAAPSAPAGPRPPARSREQLISPSGSVDTAVAANVAPRATTAPAPSTSLGTLPSTQQVLSELVNQMRASQTQQATQTAILLRLESALRVRGSPPPRDTPLPKEARRLPLRPSSPRRTAATMTPAASRTPIVPPHLLQRQAKAERLVANSQRTAQETSEVTNVTAESAASLFADNNGAPIPPDDYRHPLVYYGPTYTPSSSGPRIKLERWDGTKENLERFIDNCLHVFHFTGLPQMEWAAYAQAHIDGMPGNTLVQERRGWAQWQEDLAAGRPVGPDLGSAHLFNWWRFTLYLRKVWGDNRMFNTALRKLGKICQVGSIDTYVSDFRALVVTAKPQPNRTLIMFFQKGLRQVLEEEDDLDADEEELLRELAPLSNDQGN